MTRQLAVFGGPKAVREPYRDRWRNVAKSGLRSLLAYASRDENTSIGGKGPIGEFERRFKEFVGSDHALAMNSGTAALHSAFFAVGVGPGDEVIVPTYTFPASATPIVQLGGTPVFCDVDERTFTADFDDVERRITSKTKAICLVHIWGNPARLDRFLELCRRRQIALIEDCSHAHGAQYNNRHVGTWGDVGCFSLQGEKAVSAGEGGVAVTNDAHLFDRMLLLGHFGRTRGEQILGEFQVDNLSLGCKFRPHLYGVLLASDSLQRLPELNRLRKKNYSILRQELSGLEALSPQEQLTGATRGGFLRFVFRFHSEHAGGINRDAFVRAAKAEGVPIAADYYTNFGERARLLHECDLFTGLDYQEFGGALRCYSPPKNVLESFPVANSLAESLVSFPAFAKVSEKFIVQCAAAIRKVVNTSCLTNDWRC